MRLTANERELVITATDAESELTVFCDSIRFRRVLLRLCERLGVEPVRRGAGFECRLPLRAMKFAAPRKVTAAQREALRQGRHRKPNPPPEGLDNPGGSEGSGTEDVS